MSDLVERLEKQEYCARWHQETPTSDAALILDDSLPKEAAAALKAAEANAEMLRLYNSDAEQRVVERNKLVADLTAARTRIAELTNLLRKARPAVEEYGDLGLVGDLAALLSEQAEP